MAKGYIYIFTKPSFPEWVKIGFAHNVEVRLKQLNRGSVKDEARKPPFDFLKYGIKVGSKLTFVNDESVVVTVLDGRHVAYKEETTSLSGLAEQLMNCKTLQGTRYFKYKGELLTDYRDRVDSKKVKGSRARSE